MGSDALDLGRVILDAAAKQLPKAITRELGKAAKATDDPFLQGLLQVVAERVKTDSPEQLVALGETLGRVASKRDPTPQLMLLFAGGDADALTAMAEAYQKADKANKAAYNRAADQLGVAMRQIGGFLLRAAANSGVLWVGKHYGEGAAGA